MKKIAILLLGAVSTASCKGTVDPQFVKKVLQEQVLKQNIEAYIDKCQAYTLLPEKETLKMKSYHLVSSQIVEGKANEHVLTFDISLEDEEKVVYEGAMEVIYNVFDETSGFKDGDIATWNAAGSSNKNLPTHVTIERPFKPEWYTGKGRNVTQEIHDQSTLQKFTDKVKNVKQVEGLKSVYENVHVSNSKINHLNFKYDLLYSYWGAIIKGAYVDADFVVNVAGDYKGEQNIYDLTFKTDNVTNTTSIDWLKMEPHDPNQACKVLKADAYPKVIKELQDKKLLPIEELTQKKAECEVLSSTPYGVYVQGEETKDMYFQTKYNVENADGVNFEIIVPQDFNRDTGKLTVFGGIKYFNWDTKAAAIKSDGKLPQEYFLPAHDCKEDQTKIPYDKETPAKLFNFIVKEEPIDELKGQKYTVSDIKVRHVQTFCDDGFRTFYGLTGVLTTSSGEKWRADVTGTFISKGTEEVQVADPPKQLKPTGLLQRLRGAGKVDNTSYHYEKKEVTNKMTVNTREFTKI